MEGLDLPAHGIPVQLFDSVFARPDGKVGDQLPVDRLAILGRIALGGMENREHQRRIHLLFGDWSKDPDAAVAEFKNGFSHSTFLIAHFDSVQPLHAHLSHLFSDSVIAVARKPVYTRSQKEVSAGLMGDREQFVDVALAIADVDDTFRFGQQRCRLPHVLKPAITLFLFDRDACRVDAALERVRAMNLSLLQNLIAASPSGRPSVVTTKLECIRIPQDIWWPGWPPWA